MVDTYDAWYEYLDEAKEAGHIACLDDAHVIIRVKFKLDDANAMAVARRWMAYDTASNNLTWHGKGTHGEVADGKLNDRYTVFKIVYAADGKHAPYVIYSKLPGIKTHLGRYATDDAAKERAVQALTHWLYRAGLAGL